MAEGVYRVTELIGVSTESWEAAARNAIETAAMTVRDLRIAEAHRFDVTIENGTVKSYRVRLNVSFKYEPRSRDPLAAGSLWASQLPHEPACWTRSCSKMPHDNEGRSRCCGGAWT